MQLKLCKERIDRNLANINYEIMHNETQNSLVTGICFWGTNDWIELSRYNSNDSEVIPVDNSANSLCWNLHESLDSSLFSRERCMLIIASANEQSTVRFFVSKMCINPLWWTIQQNTLPSTLRVDPSRYKPLIRFTQNEYNPKDSILVILTRTAECRIFVSYKWFVITVPWM